MAVSSSMTSEEYRLKTHIHSNHYIREIIQRSIQNFLQLRDEVLSKPEIKNLTIFTDILSPVIEGLCIEQLQAFTRCNKIQLALCGENSSGKTAFLHTFLGIGKILPSGDGPVTARITKFTYTAPQQASICLYKNLRDQTVVEKVDISSFFAKEKPDWMGIGRILERYSRRPEDIKDKPSEFDRWARYLLEIRIPSSILALGIDIYDTPGFLFDDAPVLKEILHDLVELIRPTIVFLYANPSTDDGTRDCFFAMEVALHDIDNTSIFFLNSKADVQRMPKFRKDMSREQFLSMLEEERTERYTLLLKTPFVAYANLEGLSDSVNQCSCFDMCSVNSQMIKPYGPLINEMAIERIIRFVADDDMRMTKRVCRLILPIIDAFFQFFHLTHNRTAEQLLQVKYDGMNWSRKYFELYTEQTQRFLDNLFGKVFTRLNREEEKVLSIIQGMGKYCESPDRFVPTVINFQVIRPAIHETIKESMDDILKSIRLAAELSCGYITNDILVRALGQQEISDFAAMLLDNRVVGNASTPSILYMVNTFATPIITCAKSLETKTREITELSFDTFKDEWAKKRLSASKLRDFVHNWMLEMKEKLDEQKATMHRAVALAGDRQRTVLENLIEQTYSTVSPQLSLQQETVKRIEIHTHRFITIECELRAAQDMARFPDHTPKLRLEQSRSTVFSIFVADWGDEKNLIVKKLTQPIPDQPHVAYYEAHHHLQIEKLQHPYIINLRYLYSHRLDDGSSELWMIFPAVSLTLRQFLDNNRTSILLEQVLQWMIRITKALVDLHKNERAHRNVTLNNIVLNDFNQAYLMDFGDWNEDGDLSLYHHPSLTACGINDDIIALGHVGRILSDFLKNDEHNSIIIFEYNELMNECLACDKNPIETDFVWTCLTNLLDK